VTVRHGSRVAPRTAPHTTTIGPAAALTCLMWTHFNVSPANERAATSVTGKIKVGLWQSVMIRSMIESM
jgi:hypothetical protein